MNLHFIAHTHPLTMEDCIFLRRVALSSVIAGCGLALFLIVRELAALETALAAASGV
ncbi:hypothetical protein [Martelella sp. HB161492]|uniref:hypothetical protein n=1 Tax=Martelella sp. HB161492 TaxID=2720726 RepID=UPI00159252FD|nr:hypothetical protein [Martelella sp. HB161492]